MFLYLLSILLRYMCEMARPLLGLLKLLIYFLILLFINIGDIKFLLDFLALLLEFDLLILSFSNL